MITVYLFGKFRQKVSNSIVENECTLEIENNEEDTIASIIERLCINPQDVSHIFLNYQYSASTRKIQSGDRLAIFPKEMSLLYRQYFVKYTE